MEIEFRAISKETNKWVHGSLLLDYHSTRYGKITAICYNRDGITMRHPVIKETIDQYTGNKDQGGTKIYKGDILANNESFLIDGIRHQ